MKQWWKRSLGLTMAAVMSLGLVACGGSSTGKSTAESATGGKQVVTVWATGSENVGTMYQTLKDAYNKQSDKYELKVQFMLSGTGAASLRDMLAAAFKADQKNTDYDIIDMNDDDISYIMSVCGEKFFEPLDEKLVKESGVTALPATGKGYAQPFRGTTVVFAYNSKNMPELPSTMDDVFAWVKAHPGRFVYNTPGTGGSGDAFARTLVYNLLPEEARSSDDEKWVAEWDKGFDVLKDWHQYMYQSGGSVVYPNKNQGTLDLLANEQIDLCPAWADMVLTQKKTGTLPESIKIGTVTPALTGATESLAIPVMGTNKEGAKDFMRWMLSPEAQDLLLSEMAAIPLIPFDQLSNKDLVAEFSNLKVDQFRTMSIGKLGKTFNEKWDNTIGVLASK